MLTSKPTERWKAIRIKMALRHEEAQSGVTYELIKGRGKTEPVVAARKRVAKELRKVRYRDARGELQHVFTLTEIGQLLGRDHTTAIYAINSVVYEDYKRRVESQEQIKDVSRKLVQRARFKEKVYDLYTQGYCTPELGRRFGRTSSAIARLIREHAHEIGEPDPVGKGRGRTGLITRPIGELA